MDPRQSVTLVDARIEPAREVGTVTAGGGIVIGPDVPYWVSTLRNGLPAVSGLEASSVPALRLEGDYLWGGVAVQPPGTFVAEYAPRLLFSARERPESKILFLMRKNGTVDDLADWFWDVLEWLGIDRGRVEFVGETPVVVERLTVFPQAEHLTGALDDLPSPRGQDPTGLPNQDYLEALAENSARKGLAPIENEILYVSRAGMSVPLGGEAYIEDLLRAAGVCVIRPEELDVTEQMRYFAGARDLVFAEGSALHFRQLIGYYPQRITVLQRRPGRQVARGPLEPRSDTLRYANVVDGIVLGPFDRNTGIPVGWVALPHTDPVKLITAFSTAGVNLGSLWDAQAFRDQQEADLLNWAHYVRGISRKDTLRYALNAAVSLTALGEPSELVERIVHEIEPDRPLSALQDVGPLTAERDLLLRELDSVRSSTSLKIGRALLSPAIYVKKRYSRRAR